MTELPPPPVRRLIAFDLDGTLVDSSRDLASAVNATLARIEPGAAPLSLDRVRSFIGSGARNLVAKSVAAAGVRAPVDDVLSVFMEEYERRLLDTTVFYPGAREALDELDTHALAVLTNKPGGMSRRILDGLGVGPRFFRVIGGDDLPEKKPDPAGLLALADEAGLPVAGAFMVGDSAIDVLTGRAAGARTAAVTYGFDAESLRETPPDHLLADLRQLRAILAGP